MDANETKGGKAAADGRSADGQESTGSRGLTISLEERHLASWRRRRREDFARAPRARLSACSLARRRCRCLASLRGLLAKA